MGQAQIEHIYSVPLQGSREPGFSHIYRNSQNTKELLTAPDQNTHSMKDVLLNSLQKYGHRDCMGNIQLHTIEVDGKVLEDRKIKKYTYREIYEKAENLGSYLYKNKLYFQDEKSGMKLVGIYARNRYEWAVADFACILYGMTVVPLYNTLGIQNLTYCLEHSEISCLFVEAETIKSLIKLKGHGNLQNLISYDRLSPEVQKQMEKMKFKIHYFDELTQKTQDFLKHDDIKVTQSNCLTFSYTSGTTGPPKGAMIGHGNVISFLAGLKSLEFKGFNENDTYVSFLPLPHIMERCGLAAFIYSGSFIGFYCGDIMKIRDDIAFLKPTILIAVPRLFNRIAEAVQKKFQEMTGVGGWLVNKAVTTKLDSLRISGNFTNRFYDKLIFNKVREGFGGRVRLILTGSAPIKKQVHEFMKIIMCCPFLEGYGQTENTGGAFGQRIYDPTCGHVGGVSQTFEFRLSDIPEMNYTSDDVDEQGRPTPRGEIWLRGPPVFMGYYKDEEKTKETVTKDGWLKTGDVGMLLPGSNALKIIDRKKNIFKLQQGEYVAAEKVENIYKQCPIIAQIFIYGESHQNFCIAILSVNKNELINFAEENKIQGPFEELCSNKNLRIALCRQLEKMGKQNGLMSFEQPKNIFIDSETFEARKILTNTMKLQRFEAKKYYRKQIEEMYEENMLPLKQ